MDTVSKFQAEAKQETASEGLAQGPYVAAIAGFEPATLQTKGDESTDEPPRPTIHCLRFTVRQAIQPIGKRLIVVLRPSL